MKKLTKLTFLAIFGLLSLKVGFISAPDSADLDVVTGKLTQVRQVVQTRKRTRDYIALILDQGGVSRELYVEDMTLGSRLKPGQTINAGVDSHNEVWTLTVDAEELASVSSTLELRRQQRGYGYVFMVLVCAGMFFYTLLRRGAGQVSSR